MRDVAERAGVSVTSVSHFVNKTRPISNAMQVRIEQAMAELSFKPNALARSLRLKQTKSVGVIVPDSTNPFFANITHSIEKELFAYQYNVILGNSDSNVDRALIYLRVMTERQVDGLIFIDVGASGDALKELLPRLSIPLVLVDRVIPGLDVDYVTVTNTKGGFDATNHLLSLGHRRIACLTGPPDLPTSADRRQGYIQALTDAGISPDEKLIYAGDFQIESGYTGGIHLLERSPRPTAIFAANDLMAVGVMRAAADLGLSVPAELSVVGFDDIPLARFSTPALTTITQPTLQIGVITASFMLRRIQDEQLPPEQKILETSLVVRHTTGPVPAAKG
jgi:LacI family transcriptional regulator